MKHIERPLLLGGFLVAVVVSVRLIMQGDFQHNWIAIVAIHSLQQPHRHAYSETQDAIRAYGRDSCQTHWLMGLAAFLQGDQVARDNEWAEGIRCGREFVASIKTMQPNSRLLAELAVENQPAEPESWFWLAAIEEEDSPERAIGLMVQGLRLRPKDGVGWYRLAELYDRVGEPYLAIDAFISSCAYLNRGSDCYVRVGNIYERLGSIRLAIYYYRLSIFEGAHQRADWLEEQFPP